jgi:hypothetical protein
VALIALLKSHNQEICRGILLTGNILQILAFVGVAKTEQVAGFAVCTGAFAVVRAALQLQRCA